ncbi:MAG: 1-deoxy-D-xylulose-5-phosphate synthase [Oceanococcus sp.]
MSPSKTKTDSTYALLGHVDKPADLRTLQPEQLPQLASEVRRSLIETLGRVGGHFGANLGAVELAIALHYAYDTPNDRLIWDVGHQAYPHKILTGRRRELDTIRKLGGLAPFPCRDESEYDAFGVGHSSTSISAAAGMAAAKRVTGQQREVVAVIGDGGMTAGMAFEAMNHLGSAGLDVLVVYNDNDMSISENVGGLRDHSARLVQKLEQASATESLRNSAFERREPSRAASQEREAGALFETLGMHYFGPVDGHDMDALLAAFEEAKRVPGPKLLHVLTVKGHGFAPAEAAPIKYHAVPGFDPVTGATPPKKPHAKPTYTDIFSDWICQMAELHPALVAVTPAMREGSGLVEFERRYPERYFDVAIAEQHAVTFGAGLAADGAKPVVAIYSSFLQRAYDQLIHDVALQNLPVMFAIDRGGLVGGDGATHHGAYDLSYLRCIPNMAIMAPSDEEECQRLLTTGLLHNGPTAVRYPRGTGPGVELSDEAKPIPIGKARMVRQGKGRRQPRVAILSFGPMLAHALEAGEILDADVVDMRFIRPLDERTILDMANQNDLIVTLEDNALAGGAGSAVNEVLLAQHDQVRVLNLGLPDQFIEHGERDELLQQCGLDTSGILSSIRKRLRARDLDNALNDERDDERGPLSLHRGPRRN